MIKEVDDISVLYTLVDDYRITKRLYNQIRIFEFNGRIVGFIDYAIIYDKVELNYIKVIPEYCNQGIASKLMEFLIAEANVNKCINITLEVRISNIKAINLYKKFDFKEVARRSNYYHNEDAIMMMKVIS